MAKFVIIYVQAVKNHIPYIYNLHKSKDSHKRTISLQFSNCVMKPMTKLLDSDDICKNSENIITEKKHGKHIRADMRGGISNIFARVSHCTQCCNTALAIMLQYCNSCNVLTI